MNVAVIGSGGREHALAYKISESRLLDKLFVIPGNPGTKLIAENVEIKHSDFEAILKFCKKNKIELVVIGPEQPLVDGLSDFLRENNILVFGPNKTAAEIEGDKSFSKNLMKKYNIPTADFNVFNYMDIENAINYADSIGYPVVIKAAGIAAGKGVTICNNKNAAENAIRECLEDERFGDSGDRIVVEEFLQGEEVSIFAITDGKDYILLPPSQDHKQIYDGDKGPNTGGMGAYSPVSLQRIYKKLNIPQLTNNDILKEIERDIVKPTISALRNEKKEFNGCLYCGLMITKDGAKVIEYNCRFGDPETQAIVMTVEGDFLQLLYTTAIRKIDKNSVKYNGGASVCVVAASEGYPGAYDKGFEITGLSDIFDKNVMIFHAGTTEKNGKVFTNGGRVLSATSFVSYNNISNAKTASYKALSQLKYNGIYYRKDISDKAVIE